MTLIPNPEYEHAEIELGWITHPALNPYEFDPYPLRFRLKDNSELTRRLQTSEEIVSLSVPSHLEVP